MSRLITVAAAQLGPVPRGATRASVVARMLALMAQAARERATLVVFPELALTSFFPRWSFDEEAELDTRVQQFGPLELSLTLFESTT